MLTITKRLRRYATKNWGAASDLTDNELRKLFGQKLIDGVLTVDDIRDIESGTKEPKKKPAAKPEPKKKAAAKGAGADDEAKKLAKAVNAALDARGVGTSDLNPAKAFSQATRVRVKEAAESYSSTKKGATYPMTRGLNGLGGPHPFAGQPARFDGNTLDEPSDRDKAVALAYVRWMANANNSTGQPLPRWLRMTDHDRELMLYAAHNEKWSGVIKGENDSELVVKRQKLAPNQIKALLDDSVSGGIEITPVVFDDALILTPVLYGELFPFVNTQTIAKGRRVKGAAMINPEFTSGTAEGTNIQPFNTSSFVSAFDTPIYPATAAIEIGMDFEEDSPVDLGGQVVQQFGLKAMEWLDRVIAVGNGGYEPLGIFNASGTGAVGSTFGVAGPLTVSDFEGMMFGVGKEYRTEAGAYMAYFSNDYTYRKARAIRVGPGDERRVFGMDHAAYTLLDTPYKVQNNIPDGFIGYGNLRRYQMYRRLGMQVRVETGGRQLALNNTRLIVVRMRYGGQPNKGAAFAIMNDAQVV